MRIFLSILFTLSMLQAQSINQLIQQSLKKHPSLKTIQYRLSAMDERIEKSQQWGNPDLSFTINDIQFEDPTDRSLEPMQYNAINFFISYYTCDAHKLMYDIPRNKTKV